MVTRGDLMCGVGLMGEQMCTKCGVSKDEEQYYYKYKHTGKRDRTCKQCRKSQHVANASSPCETCGIPSQGKQCNDCYLKTKPKNYTCSIDDCDSKRHCKGYCAKHYYTEYQRDNGPRHTYDCAICLKPYETYRPARGSHPVCSETCRSYLIMWTAGGNTNTHQGQCRICYATCTQIGTQPVCASRECWDANGDVSKRMSQARRMERIRTNGDYEPINRQAIFNRDSYRCHICKGLTDRDATYPDPRYPTLDHLVPVSLGGTHTASNIATCCLRCNVVKGANSSGEQLAIIG